MTGKEPPWWSVKLCEEVVFLAYLWRCSLVAFSALWHTAGAMSALIVGGVYPTEIPHGSSLEFSCFENIGAGPVYWFVLNVCVCVCVKQITAYRQFYSCKSARSCEFLRAPPDGNRCWADFIGLSVFCFWRVPRCKRKRSLAVCDVHGPETDIQPTDLWLQGSLWKVLEPLTFYRPVLAGFLVAGNSFVIKRWEGFKHSTP